MTPALQAMQDDLDAALERRIEYHRQCMCFSPTRERRDYHEQEMKQLRAQFEQRQENQ